MENNNSQPEKFKDRIIMSMHNDIDWGNIREKVILRTFMNQKKEQPR